MSFLLALHAFTTLYMVGLIWFVQIVHYPLMGKVGEAGFAQYEQLHQKYTSWAVGPAMLVEVVTAVAIALFAVRLDYPPMLAWVGLGLIVLLWLSTAAIQIPCHRKLESGFDAGAHRRLVRSNWIRTVAWSARGVLVVVAMA